MPVLYSLFGIRPRRPSQIQDVARSICDVVQSYVRVPLTNPLMVHRDKLRTAWIALRNKVLDACVGVPVEHWTRVLFPLAHGITGQVIMILIANKWNPSSFDSWKSPDTVRWDFTIYQ